jgi:hypothetical protein
MITNQQKKNFFKLPAIAGDYSKCLPSDLKNEAAHLQTA